MQTIFSYQQQLLQKLEKPKLMWLFNILSLEHICSLSFGLTEKLYRNFFMEHLKNNNSYLEKW